MNARQILTQAIDAYNIDTFDDEQKHLHVTIRESENHTDKTKTIGIVIPINGSYTTINKTSADFGSDELAYQYLLMTFIHYSLNHLTK